jgi:hypothetical protein
LTPLEVTAAATHPGPGSCRDQLRKAAKKRRRVAGSGRGTAAALAKVTPNLELVMKTLAALVAAFLLASPAAYASKRVSSARPKKIAKQKKAAKKPAKKMSSARPQSLGRAGWGPSIAGVPGMTPPGAIALAGN